jgi:hypothetical protein
MTDRIGKEHTMKRIAAIGAVVTAFAVAPSLAAGANGVAQASPRVSTEVVRIHVTTQVAHVQVAQVRRVQTAVLGQRHVVQVKLATRLTALRLLSR